MGIEREKMTVARLERWISMLPPQELDQPCVSVDGTWLTPRQILREAKAGTELGKKAQAKWETTRLGTEEDMLAERIKRRLGRYPPDKPLFITVAGMLTPQQMIREIEAGTDIGKRFVQSERSYLRYMDKLKERV